MARITANQTARLAGAAAGLAGGLFGGGGGMAAVPLLRRLDDLSERKLYPTCVGLIFPVCGVSAAVYLLTGAVSLTEALPYLAGGTLGGALGGRLYGKIPTGVLRRIFALFMVYAGVRYLW